MAQRVLIVDDERSIRLTLSQTVAGMGLEVSAAMTAEEALERINAQPCELILLDLRLPGMDGLTLLRRLMQDRPDLKVIIITAHGTVDNAVEALKLGAVDFIQKPFTPAEMRELVRRVLDRDLLDEQRAADYRTCLELAKRAIRGRRFDAATEHLRQALRHEPNHPEVFNLLGMVMEVQGEQRQALSNYRAALDFAPGYAPAQANLKRATERRSEGPRLEDV